MDVPGVTAARDGLRQRALKGGLLALIVGLGLLRLVNLKADFPEGITTSGVLYTDEGRLAAAAVRDALTGEWYQAGEVNFAVLMPVGQALQRISFAVLGPSLAAARATIVVSFLSLTALTALLVRQSYGDWAGLLAALLLTSNYVAFAYSRLATMDLAATNLVTASLWAAGGLKGKGKVWRFVAAGALLSAAILTKSYAIWGAPLLGYLAWRGGTNRRERMGLLAASGLTVAGLAGGYLGMARSQFPADYEALVEGSTLGLYTNAYDWLRHLPQAAWQTTRLGGGLAALASGVTALALAKLKQFRSEGLVQLLAGYAAVYLALLSLNGYRPPRYNLPLLVPLAGLAAGGCVRLAKWLEEGGRRRWRMAPALLAGVVALQGAWQIGTYMAKPSYSFYQMAQAVGNIIEEREGKVRGVVLFGELADSVALEIGTKAADSLLAADAAEKIRQYRPRYMIVHTSNIVELAEAEGGEAREAGRWDVFGNYYAAHQAVRLYVVRWPGEGGEAPAGAGR